MHNRGYSLAVGHGRSFLSSRKGLFALGWGMNEALWMLTVSKGHDYRVGALMRQRSISNYWKNKKNKKKIKKSIQKIKSKIKMMFI
jgi:hypothetical protein